MSSMEQENTPNQSWEGELEGLLGALRQRVEQWPLPLAHPAAQCLHWASLPASLVNWSFQLYGQVLRVTSLYLTGAYFASEIARADLNTAIQEDLRRPLLGKWRGYLRDALDRLVSAHMDAPLVRAVSAFHRAVGVRADCPGPASLRDGRVVRRSTTVLDAILEIRNDLFHGARGVDEETARLILLDLAPLLKRLVEAWDPLLNFRLVARSATAEEVHLHGPLPPDMIDDHVCELIDPEGQHLPLKPLALVDLLGETLRNPDAPPVDLLLYDGRQEKRLRYLGLQETHERKEFYTDFSLALERKVVAARLQDPVDRWDGRQLQEALALRQFQLEVDGRAPSPPEIVIPRPQLQERLAEFLAGAAHAVLLTGPAGAGRSVLLSQLVRQSLAQGIPAAAFSASLLAPMLNHGSLGELLAEVLIMQASFSELIAAAERPARNVGLVLGIDALESIGSVEKIRTILDGIESLCSRHRGSKVKFLLAIQSQALARTLEVTPPLDENLWFHSLIQQPDGESLSVPELPVEELHSGEAEALYHALCQTAGAGTPRTPWELLPERIQERLRLPGFAARFVALTAQQIIRHEEILTVVERTFLEQTLYGRRYDPRRRIFVDAFPSRKRLLEEVAQHLVESRRAEAAVAALHLQDDDYAEILALGILHELCDRASPETLVVRFASPAAFAVVAADLLQRDRLLLDKVLFASDLAELCDAVPGLEMALAEVLERDLEGVHKLTNRLLQENMMAIRQRLIASALLRLAEVRKTAVRGILQELKRIAVTDTLPNIVREALDEGKIFSRPEAAGTLADAVLSCLTLVRSEDLLRLSRALRRAGRAPQAEQVLRCVPADATPITEAKRLYFLGSLLRDQGRWQEALSFLREAKAAHRGLGQQDGFLIASAALAETLSLLGQHEAAALELQTAECEGHDASLEIELRFRLKHAMSLRMRGLLRKAYTRCEEVLRRSTSKRLLHLTARAETEMGIIHALLDDAAGAVELLNRAITAKRQLGDNRGLKQAYLSLGFAHAMSGAADAARAAYEQSLALNQETNDMYGELLCLEFLLRLDPSLVKQPDLLRAVTLANRAAEWKNPRIHDILDKFNQQLTGDGGPHEPI